MAGHNLFFSVRGEEGGILPRTTAFPGAAVHRLTGEAWQEERGRRRLLCLGTSFVLFRFVLAPSVRLGAVPVKTPRPMPVPLPGPVVESGTGPGTEKRVRNPHFSPYRGL
jgi:hypothetical protein